MTLVLRSDGEQADSENSRYLYRKVFKQCNLFSEGVEWGRRRQSAHSTMAFELDDYHAESPIHSSSVVLPALFALVQHQDHVITESQFLLAAVIGYELGP